jgi:hypothetical protein
MNQKETPPSRFETEMTRMMKLVIAKLEEHDTRFDRLEGKVDLLSAQITEIGLKLLILTN